MPRPKLSNVSIAALQAEIQKRMNKLSQLCRQRDALDRQIAEIQALAGEGLSAKPGRRASLPAGLRVAVRRRKRFPQTGEQFILSLVGGKGATTAEINRAWKKAGRGGIANTTINRLFRAKKIRREKLPVGKGSTYTHA